MSTAIMQSGRTLAFVAIAAALLVIVASPGLSAQPRHGHRTAGR
jgi:hypothetical protein